MAFVSVERWDGKIKTEFFWGKKRAHQEYSNIRGGVTTENAVALYKKKESNFGIFRVKSFFRGIKLTFILHRKWS